MKTIGNYENKEYNEKEFQFSSGHLRFTYSDDEFADLLIFTYDSVSVEDKDLKTIEPIVNNYDYKQYNLSLLKSYTIYVNEKKEIKLKKRNEWIIKCNWSDSDSE